MFGSFSTLLIAASAPVTFALPPREPSLDESLKIVVSVSSQPVEASLECEPIVLQNGEVPVAFPCSGLDVFETDEEALAMASLLWSKEIVARDPNARGSRSVAELLAGVAVIFAGETLDDAGRPDIEPPIGARFKERDYDFNWVRRPSGAERENFTMVLLHLMQRTGTCSGALFDVIARMEQQEAGEVRDWGRSVKRHLGSSLYPMDRSCV